MFCFSLDGLTGNETNPDSQGEPVKVTDDAPISGGYTFGPLLADPGTSLP